jgi:hypothetical protein
MIIAREAFLDKGPMGPLVPAGLEGGFAPRDAVIPVKEITGFEEAQAPGQGQGEGEKRSRICCPHTLGQFGTVLGIPRN